MVATLGDAIHNIAVRHADILTSASGNNVMVNTALDDDDMVNIDVVTDNYNDDMIFGHHERVTNEMVYRMVLHH